MKYDYENVRWSICETQLSSAQVAYWNNLETSK